MEADQAAAGDCFSVLHRAESVGSNTDPGMQALPRQAASACSADIATAMSCAQAELPSAQKKVCLQTFPALPLMLWVWRSL